MNEFLEQIKGYVNAFEVINNGNYEGTDYLVDEIEFNSEFWWSFEEIIFVEMLGFKSDIYKRTKF